MARERGITRSIAQALLRGPDFRKLRPAARLTFLAAKILAPVYGVEALTREELRTRLQGGTGLRMQELVPALADLEGGGWVKHSDTVFWIPRQLEFEGALSPENPKHRLGLQWHLAGLPHVSIVADVCVAYADWFVAGDKIPSGLHYAVERASVLLGKPLLRVSIPSRIKEKEKEKENDPPTRAPARVIGGMRDESAETAVGSGGLVDRSRDDGNGASHTTGNGATPAQLAAWATAAVASRWGSGSRTFAADQMADDVARELAAIPPAVVQRSVFGQAQGSTLVEPPKTLRWFVPGVRRDARDVHGSPPRSSAPSSGSSGSGARGSRTPAPVGDVARAVAPLMAACPFCGDRVSWEGWQSHHQSRHPAEDLPSFTQAARTAAAAASPNA